MDGLNNNLVSKTLNGVRDTLKEFGLPENALGRVSAGDAKDYVASVNGFGNLRLSRADYSSKKNEFSKANHVVDSSAYGVGTHEAGHMISIHAMNKGYKNATVLERAKMMRSGKFDREVLKKAKKLNGGQLSGVSKYGNSFRGKAARETVAEAVSEYMTKGKKASSTSKAIVKALKSYL